VVEAMEATRAVEGKGGHLVKEEEQATL